VNGKLGFDRIFCGLITLLFYVGVGRYNLMFYSLRSQVPCLLGLVKIKVQKVLTKYIGKTPTYEI
jgi:hypothetical protein